MLQTGAEAEARAPFLQTHQRIALVFEWSPEMAATAG